MSYADELRAHYAAIRARLVPERRVNKRLPTLTFAEVPEPVMLFDLPVPPMQHWRRIVAEVASKHGTLPAALIGRKGRKVLTVARGEAMTRIRQEVRLADGGRPSIQQIGRWFDGRGHTSCIHAMRKYQKFLASDHTT